ncbi:MAG: hypothetical protein R3C11_11645 [Planctomycetaceae bacterium]
MGAGNSRPQGTAGAVLNAANEAAVQRFLTGSLRFDQIVKATQNILNAHHFDPSPDLAELKKWDRWARGDETMDLISILNWVYTVALGLGLVIFFHES